MNLFKTLFKSLFDTGPAVRRVAPSEAAQLVAEGKAALVDVREPAEWTGGVAAPAQLLAGSDFYNGRKQWTPFLRRAGESEVILYCLSGARSGRLARQLAREGFKVANMGGVHGWSRAGLPMRKVKSRG